MDAAADDEGARDADGVASMSLGAPDFLVESPPTSDDSVKDDAPAVSSSMKQAEHADSGADQRNAADADSNVQAEANVHDADADEAAEQDEAEEEEEEEEEEEPKLKYQRLGASVTEILKTDSASCIASHEKFLAIGTLGGFVHVVDFAGHETKRFAPHTAVVNDVSVDDAGEWIASCSDDGLVCVMNLFEPTSHKFSYHRPVKTLALHPKYREKVSFASGGLAQQFIVNSKGWFSFQDNVLHAGEGPIHAIRWKGSLIAWANDVGVKLYDCETGERLTWIERPRGAPPPDQYRCTLCWQDKDTLLIGWADTVQIAVVRHPNQAAAAALVGASSGAEAAAMAAAARYAKQQKRYVEIVAMFQVDCMIAGLGPFHENLVILAHVLEESDETSVVPARRIPARPELRIISRTNEDLSSDALPINGFQHYACTDYRLDYIDAGAEALFYILAPKDIVMARPRDEDDHINWLLERSKFEEALNYAEQHVHKVKAHRVLEVGEKYLRHLLELRSFERAAAVCPKLLGTHASLWEAWIYMFAKLGQLRAVIPFIPVRAPQLSAKIYELVLNFFIVEDTPGLLRALVEWPQDCALFEPQTIITRIIDRLQIVEQVDLLHALAQLYIIIQQYDKALNVYLRLRQGDVFALIKKYDLYASVRDKVLPLMLFDQQRAIQMLMANVQRIPVADVVRQLSEQPRLQHDYLHAMFNKDTQLTVDHQELQVALYAEFAPKLLMGFLRQSSYTLESALEICRAKQLHREEVFILGRMGNCNDALALIIHKLRDVQQAIEFIVEYGGSDGALWEELVKWCLQSEATIGDLLDRCPQHLDSLDPRLFITRIPLDCSIPGLRRKLVNVLSMYASEVSLRQGCNKILKTDGVALMRRMHKQQKRAVRVQPRQVCVLCEMPLCTVDLDALSVFYCGHVCHAACLYRQQEVQTRSRSASASSSALDRQSCHLCNRKAKGALGGGGSSSSSTISGGNSAAASSASSVASSAIGAERPVSMRAPPASSSSSLPSSVPPAGQLLSSYSVPVGTLSALSSSSSVAADDDAPTRRPMSMFVGAAGSAAAQASLAAHGAGALGISGGVDGLVAAPQPQIGSGMSAKRASLMAKARQ